MTTRDDFAARVAKDFSAAQGKYTPSAIERVQRIARYASPGSDIGIPWDLFEAYVTALEQTQALTFDRSAEHLAHARSLSAPVSVAHIGPEQHQLVARPGPTVSYVYPVIK